MRNLLNISIVCVSILIVFAFFVPWVTGKGSLAKPVDDITKPIQRIDITRITSGFLRIGTGVVNALTPIELEKTLAGFQIPIEDNENIKSLGLRVYLLYALPLVAVLCVVVCITGRHSRLIDLLVFIIVLGIFLVISAQIGSFSQNGLFVKIQPCIGYWLTIYLYLILSVLTFIKLLIRRGRK